MNRPPAAASLALRHDAAALARQYDAWRTDPASVDPTWAAFFEGYELGRFRMENGGEGGDDGFSGRVRRLVEDFRRLGHTAARVDPLERRGGGNARLVEALAGFGEDEMHRNVVLPDFRDGGGIPLRDLVDGLSRSYSGTIGFEFMHIRNPDVLDWVRGRAEARPDEPAAEADEAVRVLRWVLEAEAFEQFLGRKFLGEKRFSLEGAEGLMVLLNALLERCPSAGVEEIEMGMSHRGRLNVLANFLRKTLTTILYEFTSDYLPDGTTGDGDVKYHLGYENHRDLADGRVRVSLAANPSHLEAVNAVVEGKARARQRRLGDEARRRVLPLLLHGDASFSGQGAVAEVLNLSQLTGYRTGGTIHVVINNRIGFTTTTADARTAENATDVAKMIGAPILHVNGEDPSALTWAARFALDFRQTFGMDVVVDLVCYRRQGHSESDQAAFTQPLETREIAARDGFGQALKRRLTESGLIDAEEADSIEETIWQKLEAGYNRMTELSAAGDRSEFTGSTAVRQPPYSHAPVATGIAPDLLRRVGDALVALPDGFTPHPTLARRFLPARGEALAGGGRIDFALAEALAFGALLAEGTPVRLSGQDSRRGTFSQRHAVLYDYHTRERHIPLNHLGGGQALFSVHNSPLSQLAVLGFDYGYSLGYPEMLALWESQFGDFANGAQTIIDQFIASAEAKWQTPSDLVMLLPHGHEGMGPEHSSARVERFLQLCADDNLIVANCTTPAQYFHILRRQKHQTIRKPLVLMTPKSLLFRKEATSSAGEFLAGSCFQEVLPDPVAATDRVERVILCSGKVFYELDAHRREQGIRDTAILRIEQLHPFHREMLEAMLVPYPNARDFIWFQEEPANMGAWNHLAPALEAVTGGLIRYVGRPASASPATGARAIHFREQKSLAEAAFGEFHPLAPPRPNR